MEHGFTILLSGSVLRSVLGDDGREARAAIPRLPAPRRLRATTPPPHHDPTRCKPFHDVNPSVSGPARSIAHSGALLVQGRMGSQRRIAQRRRYGGSTTFLMSRIKQDLQRESTSLDPRPNTSIHGTTVRQGSDQPTGRIPTWLLPDTASNVMDRSTKQDGKGAAHFGTSISSCLLHVAGPCQPRSSTCPVPPFHTPWCIIPFSPPPSPRRSSLIESRQAAASPSGYRCCAPLRDAPSPSAHPPPPAPAGRVAKPRRGPAASAPARRSRRGPGWPGCRTACARRPWAPAPPSCASSAPC
ncbi:hypothetical protein VTK73DRAFT_4087 [Phialemonium thermophilum]|uniref:Uncharacterized protein n=1 Tax=Phialemonium thermophilum TaxID=223376 RepID=A0ABR3VBR7_9PEZI